jgi:phosphoglucosamine mutase
MSKYFGTDGFRGRFGIDIKIELALKIGQYLGFYYGLMNVEAIIIECDPRESSPFLKTAVTMGINSLGVDVYDLEEIPTPGVAYLSSIYQMPGLMISASHNPYWDNGIKLFNENGEKMDEAIIQALDVFMDSKDTPYTEKEKGRIIPFSAGKKTYIDYLVSKEKDYTGFNVAIDLANGAASFVAEDVFNKLNCNFTFINDNPDGKNINNGFGSTCLGAISQVVVKGYYNIGFSYDGDSDRCLFVDEAGNELSGDRILYLIGKYMKLKGLLENDTVVGTIMSNIGLDKELEKENINIARVDDGDKNVYSYLKQNNCNFGGEQSGHIIFLDDLTTGDGILTSIKILNILTELKLPISQLLEDITIYPQILKNVVVKDKDAVLNNKEINDLILEKEKELSSGIVLVRASDTDPKIRVMAEANTFDLALSVVDDIINAIEELNVNL